MPAQNRRERAPRRVVEPAPPPPAPPAAAAARLPTDGCLRAVEPLRIGSTLCHMPGDLVPADNVHRNGWQRQVEPATPPESDVDG